MTRRRRSAGRLRALSLLTALAIIASLGLSALGAAPARAQDDPTGDTGGNNVQGNTYTSPDFGYAISWDRTWDATDDTVETDPNVYNGLTLENEASTVYVEGTGVSIDGATCVGNVASTLNATDSAFTNVEQTEDNLDADVPNATYTFDADDGQDGTVNLTLYIQCQPIADGDAVLDVIQITSTADYDDQVAEREDLLANLVLEGEAPDIESDQPDVEDDAGDAPTDGGDTTAAASQVAVAAGDGDRPANEDELTKLFDSSITDINGFWAREFPLLSGGDEYTPPDGWIAWTGQVDTGCGPGTSFSEDGQTAGDGPFYCPVDQTVYLDLNFANIQLQIVDNDFVIPVVMAHELGHHIQQLLGLEVCEETPCLDPNLLTSQEIEYMADCWAGAWSQDAELRGRLGSRDIDANIVQYAEILGGGIESADIGGHGRGSERVWWFLNGYLEGGARCLDTSSVTTGILDEDAGSPEDSRETPTADESPTADETPETPAGTTVALNEDIELPAYTFKATKARTRDAIDTEQPDEEQFLVVYFHAEIADDGDGPFDYGSWVLVDDTGASYEVDENATNQLLSSAYENGTEEDLQGGGGYDLAMVFDVPADGSGLTLVNADAGVTVDLGV